MSILVSILKMATPVPKLTNYTKYLFVGPHPDDIEVSSGGTVARLVQLGKEVSFAIVTNGCVGAVDKSLTSEQIVEIRKQESIASSTLLGVTDVTFMDFDDGNTSADYNKIVDRLVQVLVEKQPDVVFCPDHLVKSECHTDHLNIGKAVTEAVLYATWEKMAKRHGANGCIKQPVISYYYTDSPNSYICVNKTHNLHMQSIGCHKSQFTEQDYNNFKTYFNLREICFGARRLMGRAEGFRTLSATMQHCVPEASKF